MWLISIDYLKLASLIMRRHTLNALILIQI